LRRLRLDYPRRPSLNRAQGMPRRTKRSTACPVPGGKPATRRGQRRATSFIEPRKPAPMTLQDFRARLHGEQFQFAETLAFITEHYAYQPSAFRNGDVENAEGHNEGSCKTLGLALLEGL